MSSPVRKLRQSEEVRERIGTVIAVEPGGFRVATDDGELRALRAVGCLVRPELEDRVLLADAGAECWILTVLVRRPGAGVQLESDGDLGLRLGHGRFTVAAQEGIDLVSAREVAVVADTVGVTAREGTVRFDALSYLGRALVGEVERIKLVASSLDSVLERWSQRVKRAFRVVELDHLRTKQLDYQAEQSARIHAHDAIITADQLAKIDAGQIHIG
jgi:hypothetical protein